MVNFIAALNSNRLMKQMDSRIALVTRQFFIRLLKPLRDDVLDVWLHESLKLMKRVAQGLGHNQDCSRGPVAGTKPGRTEPRRTGADMLMWSGIYEAPAKLRERRFGLVSAPSANSRAVARIE